MAKVETVKIPASAVRVGMLLVKSGDQPRIVVGVSEYRGKLRITVQGTKNPEQCGGRVYGPNQLVNTVK